MSAGFHGLDDDESRPLVSVELVRSPSFVDSACALVCDRVSTCKTLCSNLFCSPAPQALHVTAEIYTNTTLIGRPQWQDASWVPNNAGERATNRQGQLKGLHDERSRISSASQANSQHAASQVQCHDRQQKKPRRPDCIVDSVQQSNRATPSVCCLLADQSLDCMAAGSSN
jgi:hypothetical protein